MLAIELVKTLNLIFEKGDLGTLTGIGPVPQTDVSVTAPRRPAFFFEGDAFQPLLQQYRLSLVDRRLRPGAKSPGAVARQTTGDRRQRQEDLLRRAANPKRARIRRQSLKL